MSIKFIEDKEFDLSSEKNQDLLGTKPYAETLFEVIQKSKGKQNIGLFGGWGSGKSTIVRTLEIFIAKHNDKNDVDKIAYFKYDAWKYSNDDFRRSFIKSINSKFQVLKEDSINEILYNEVTTQDSDRNKIDINYQQVTLLLITAVILILIIGKYVLPIIADDDTKSILVIVSLIASFLFYISRDFFRIVPFTVKQSKLIEPERFEETFQLIINKIFGINKTWMDKFKAFFKKDLNYKKVVVVIDNLDRCDNKNLKETLITMKNFLENENVIFLLPVDENGVTSFLDGNTEDAEEYLRKIFHQIIRLKKFTPKELVQYTKEINDNEKLNLSNIGIRLICQEFTTNPRKIIQFLNNLQTERDLLKRQIKEGYININYNTQADDFLIKLLIIRQEWNTLYRKVLDDANFLNKINKAIVGNIQYIEGFYYLQLGNEELKLTRNQKRFFQRNVHVHFEYTDPFILNIDRDKDIPDDLRTYIENGELEEIYELLSIKGEEEFNDVNTKLLLNQIENVFDYNSNKFDDYSVIALPVSNIIVELLSFDKFQIEIKANFKNYTFLKKVFTNNGFKDIIPKLRGFDDFCKLSKWFYFELNYKEPYNKLFSYLNLSIIPSTSIEGIHDNIKIFINVFQNHLDLIKGLSSNLQGKIIEDTSLLTSYEIFQSNVEVSHSLLDSSFIDSLLELLNENKIDDKKTIDIIIRITDSYIEKKYISSSSILTEFANYFTAKLQSEYNLKSTTSKGVFEIKDIIERLIDLIPKTKLKLLNIDESLFATIHIKLNNEYSSSLSDDEIDFYIKYSQLIFNYMKLNTEFSTSANIEKYFNSYFIKTDYQKLSSGINTIYQQLVAFFTPYSWNFFDKIMNKSKVSRNLNYYKTLMLMYGKSTNKKGLTSEQKSLLIHNVLSYFFYWQNYSNMVSYSVKWIKDIRKNDNGLYVDVIDELSVGNLEKYVYNLYKLNNEDLIENSFIKYLKSINNYKKFEKFIRFVGKKHSVKVQEILLLEICSSKYPPFNWMFSSRKTIHKTNFNKVVNKYMESYNKGYENTEYLNNFLKLNKTELYKTTIDNITKFLDNIDKPTKGHKTKIDSLKSKLS